MAKEFRNCRALILVGVHPDFRIFDPNNPVPLQRVMEIEVVNPLEDNGVTRVTLGEFISFVCISQTKRNS